MTPQELKADIDQRYAGASTIAEQAEIFWTSLTEMARLKADMLFSDIILCAMTKEDAFRLLDRACWDAADDIRKEIQSVETSSELIEAVPTAFRHAVAVRFRELMIRYQNGGRA